MFYKTLTYPGVFELKENKVAKTYVLQPKTFKFATPPKLYGDMRKYVNFYWESFKRHGYKGGILLTGQKGSGKTLIGMELSNLAIDEGMQVIQITNIAFKNELVSYLDSIDNAVFFFDEFGKNFNNNQQDIMLTLLSNVTGKQRIVIITENHPMRISEFIRNRPGRVRYAMHFNKLPINVVEEYCKEKNVEDKFYKDLIDAYKTIVLFQFDHLEAIVTEHLDNPDIEFKELVKLLNLEDISGTKTLAFKEIFKIGEENVTIDIVRSDPKKMSLTNFESGQWFYINGVIIYETEDNSIQKEKRFSLSFNKKDMKEMTDEEVVIETNGYRIIYSIVIERD